MVGQGWEVRVRVGQKRTFHFFAITTMLMVTVYRDEAFRGINVLSKMLGEIKKESKYFYKEVL